MIQSRADSNLVDAASQALNKIGSVLPDHLDHLFLDSPLLVHSRVSDDRAPQSGTLSELCKVIRNKERVKMVYEDLKGRETNRCVKPLGVTCFDAVWLLTAWCELRNDFRNFRVDRVRSILRTGYVFKDKLGERFKDYEPTAA